MAWDSGIVGCEPPCKQFPLNTTSTTESRKLGKRNIFREVRSKVKPGSSEKISSKIFRAVVSPSAMASTSTATTVILKFQNSSTCSNRVKHTCGEWSDVNRLQG